MAQSQTDFMQQIAHDTFVASTKKLIENFFDERWRWVDKDKIETMLRDEVKRLVESDPEIRVMIRDRLISLIKGDGPSRR